MTAQPDPSDDGAARTHAELVLERLRSMPSHRHVFGGYGPLVLAAILLLAMVLLAPSIAPERVVERPVDPAGSDPVAEVEE